MINPEYMSCAGFVLISGEIARLLFAIDAVMRPRSSQGAIAWIIALQAMLIITISLYILFGRTRCHGNTAAIRDKESLLGL